MEAESHSKGVKFEVSNRTIEQKSRSMVNHYEIMITDHDNSKLAYKQEGKWTIINAEKAIERLIEQLTKQSGIFTKEDLEKAFNDGKESQHHLSDNININFDEWFDQNFK